MHNSHVSVESLVYYCPHGPARWSHPLSVPRLSLSLSPSPLFLHPLSLLYTLSSSFHLYLLIFSLSLVCLSLSFSILFFNCLISPPPLLCRSESLRPVVNRTGCLDLFLSLSLSLSISSSSSNNLDDSHLSVTHFFVSLLFNTTDITCMAYALPLLAAPFSS